MNPSHGLTDKTVAQIHKVFAHHPGVWSKRCSTVRGQKGNYKPGFGC